MSYYTINKGTGKTVEFKGLKSQYIKYLGIVVVALFILFFLLRFLDSPMLVTLAVVGGSGAIAISFIYRMSKKYGRFGLTKYHASKAFPRFILGRHTYPYFLRRY